MSSMAATVSLLHCTSVCDRQERKMVSFSLHSCMCACVCPHPPEHPIHSPAWPASGFWWMYWSSGGWGPPQSCRPTHLKGIPYKVTSTALARCEHTSSRMRVHMDSGNNYWPSMDSHAHTCAHMYIFDTINMLKSESTNYNTIKLCHVYKVQKSP